MKRAKLSDAAREKKRRKLVSKYPVPYLSTLEVKEELFASFKDAKELVDSLPFSVNCVNTPVHRCVKLKRRYRRPRELLIDDALKVLQTVLIAD